MKIFRCPRCGEGRVFQSLLELSESCSSCGLPIRKHDLGDGAVFFVMLMVGFSISALAALTQLFFSPPWWLHMALWPPMIVVLSLYFLRFSRATLLALQYKYRPDDFV